MIPFLILIAAPPPLPPAAVAIPFSIPIAAAPPTAVALILLLRLMIRFDSFRFDSSIAVRVRCFIFLTDK